MDILLLIAHFSSASVLIPLSLVIIQWRRLPDNIALLRWLLIFNAIADTVSYVLAIHLSINNQLVGEVYMFIQFTLLLYILGNQLELKKILKVALVVFYGISLIILKSYAMSTSALNAVASLVLIIVSIVFFYKLLHELKVDAIHRQPILWIAFATLFYYSGNLFLFLTSNYLINQTDHFMAMWTLHNILNFTKNILFAVALWQNYRTVKSSV